MKKKPNCLTGHFNWTHVCVGINPFTFLKATVTHFTWKPSCKLSKYLLQIRCRQEVTSLLVAQFQEALWLLSCHAMLPLCHLSIKYGGVQLLQGTRGTRLGKVTSRNNTHPHWGFHSYPGFHPYRRFTHTEASILWFLFKCTKFTSD